MWIIPKHKLTRYFVSVVLRKEPITSQNKADYFVLRNLFKLLVFKEFDARSSVVHYIIQYKLVQLLMALYQYGCQLQ